jgi:tetratricopeptide (TPR) repeat protein
VTDLAAIGSLKVISRTSGAAVQQMTRSLGEIAGALAVQAVVQGSIRRAGDSIQVSVRLQRVPDGRQLFARDYQRPLGELPDLQREITTDLGGALGARLASDERRRLAARQPVDQRAYESYLRGRFSLDRGELERARVLFEEASRLAPGWAPPYVGLASYYVALPFSTDVAPASVLPQARAALAHALELDEGLAEAHAVNAYIRAYYEWDWRAAEAEFRRALELRPSYADAYMSYGRFLASRRRLEEAIAQVGRAEELDPLETSLPPNRALLDYFAGRYDEAEGALRAMLQVDSSNGLARWGLALVDEQQGRPEDAIAILEALGSSGLNSRSSLGHAYGVAGHAAQARQVLASLRAQSDTSYVPSYFLALVYAGLGERDQALRALERAYEERSTVLAYLLIDPRLAPLRSDSRFVALAERLNGT